MPRSVVQYDKDLPEVPDRLPYLRPDAYLIKKSDDEFELVEGRRPSKMLLVNRLREAVDRWRDEAYPGASDVTSRLFQFWFEEEHLVGDEPFHFHFGQREAIETLAYLVEVRRLGDAKALVDAFAEVFAGHLFSREIEHQTSMNGTRLIRRYVPELNSDRQQEIPPPGLARYAFKMATGSGKTVVMAMAIAWSYFHRKLVPGSDLASNFLVVAPNVIVYQRLERDFGSNRIFHQLPLIPPEWTWTVKPIMRGESGEADPAGTLFLTNIQQLYESGTQEWTPANAVDALLGRRPAKDLGAYDRSMLDRLKGLPDLVVLNDEAHHVHDVDLSWYKTLLGIHEGLPRGLSLWLDFSATPKDQNGSYFPWIVCDYPLAQAVEDRIVKAPLIVHQVNRKDPENVTQENVIEAYGDWLFAAIARWREHDQIYRGLSAKPVLFIMAEKNAFADAIGRWLLDTKEFGFRRDEVLVIHTDSAGEVTKKDLDAARDAATNIDDPTNPVKVVVSVLMLREGWDVRGVTVVLGLRPFTATAKILPEQAVGRGLRLLRGISPDQTQTLEVMGTAAFEGFVRELEVEGLGIRTAQTPPPPPIKIEPIQERIRYDIAIPLTRPVYAHEYAKLSLLDPQTLAPIFDLEEVEAGLRIKLRMEFATTATEVHRVELVGEAVPLAQDVLSSITTKTTRLAAVPGQFAQLYPVVRAYIRDRCFGRGVDLDDAQLRRFLGGLQHQRTIAGYLAKEIGKLVIEKREIQFENATYRLSATPTFVWRRRHVQCGKTIFNYVATYNDFETRFAEFLDAAPDVDRFAALAEHFTRFRVDYVSQRGAIKFYYPDFVAVQVLPDGGSVNWILETKGRLFDNVANKDEAILDWCSRVTAQTGQTWRYMRINQTVFDGQKFVSFAALEDAVLREARIGTLL
jgi:type III restriction enzyme